ncbi:uncharacterized protein LOC132042279, partial [Lycium ferocissimum]|uniref:uncharacterized protein LOC132042279 n=1 Tax=Lycium ferocissimum TaxID=112874 RepID=UPI0028162519
MDNLMVFSILWGAKQGDPLSPTLFILVAEVLSRGLNALHENLWFTGFGLPKWSPKSTTYHMQMTSSSSHPLLINKSKSSIYLHDRVDNEVFQKVERITGIARKNFPLMYLGCPNFYARPQMSFYSELISKVRNRLQGWKGKLLSFGGRAILLKHVLQAMPMHLLSSNTIGERGTHWTKWYVVCLPQDEGGLGFISLSDMSMALCAKLWWNFRTKPSLWSAFMSNKYLKKNNPILSGLGPLYFQTPSDFYCNEEINNVSDVVTQGRWNVPAIRNNLPEELAEYILNE